MRQKGFYCKIKFSKQTDNVEYITGQNKIFG